MVMSAQELTQLLIPALAGIISAVVGVVALARNVKTQQADLAAKYQEIADKAIDDVAEVKRKVVKLEKNIRERDRYIESLLRGIARLIDQIKCLDRVPVWQPEEKPPFEDDEE